MQHRSYRGKILYLTDGKGEMGREYFHVTVHGNGDRTLRAYVEMDDDDLIRDVTYTVNRAFQPLDAFVRLTIKDRFTGSAWYRFSDTQMECEAFTAGEGRIRYERATTKRAGSFGCHPVCCDTWHCAAAWHSGGTPGRRTLTEVGMSSYLPNGGSGPDLGQIDLNVDYVDDKRVTTPAGSFATRHYVNLRVGAPANRPPVEIWAFSSDFIPATIRWELLKQTYELVELDHTPVA